MSDRNEYITPEGYQDHLGNSDGEYYKNYEHDDAPVKEFSIDKPASVRGGKVCLTNSDLDRLEMKIYSNVSEELQTDESSIRSLESNIKFFKTTVQELLDTFYASMKDFELYKKRFHDILKKNHQDSLEEMEAFIKDIIQNISESESGVTSDSKSTEMFEITYDANESGKNSSDTFDEGNTPLSNVTNQDLTSTCSSTNKEEIYNIFLLSSDPCVAIKVNKRNLLSEINMKNPRHDIRKKQIASADNLHKLAAKQIEIGKYIRQRRDCKLSDVEIPVKVSYAKKNIHLDEDFIQSDGDSKSFIMRICNFLCNKFRKTALG